MAGNTKYKNDWSKEKLDRVSLTVPKGFKAKMQAHAAQNGESLNAFINRAIIDAINRDILTGIAEEVAKTNSVTIEESKKSVEFIMAIRLIESEIPGFEEFYNSGQLRQHLDYLESLCPITLQR